MTELLINKCLLKRIWECQRRSNSIIFTRESVLPFKISNFSDNNVLYDIHLILEYWFLRQQGHYFKWSTSIIKSWKCIYVLKHNVFMQFCNKIVYNFVKTMLSFDTLQMFMFVCSTVSFQSSALLDVAILVNSNPNYAIGFLGQNHFNLKELIWR